MKVTVADIVGWGTTREAQDQLPVLVRRLLRTTTPHLTALDFPGGDAVRLAGFDGECRSETATPWCPEGRTVWEMGCSDRPAAKADGDWEKRMRAPEAERQDATFIFVTPRLWDGKRAWVERRRVEGAWRDVRAFDAADLEAWLEASPATALWLAEKLGKAERDGETPLAWLDRWCAATDPHLPWQLVLSGRETEAARAVAKLRDDRLRVLTVAGDDMAEAIAFVVAALREAEAWDVLDRIVLTRAPRTVRANPGQPRRIVLANVESDEAEGPNLSEVAIVRAYPRGRLPEPADIELRHPSPERIEARLHEAGISASDAERRVRQSGASLTVLRRRLSDDPVVREPVWARADEAAVVLPFVLAGSWHAGRASDVGVLELLGDRPWRGMEADLARISSLPEAPLLRFGPIWVTVSQIDALFALGQHITVTMIDTFFAVADIVFGERDPALDLPRREWWMANVLGKDRPYSGALVRGIGDTLCILAIHGAAICGNRLGIDLQRRADGFVRNMLTNLSPEQWLSRRHLLRTLAEASPTAFLDGIEAALTGDTPAIESIMGVVEGGVTGDCLRTDLLWALETLARDPAHVARVAEILQDLCRFDIKDNWGNHPFASLTALFRAWLPQAPLDVEDRATLLRRLFARDRGTGFRLCIQLLPKLSGGIATPIAKPRWRLYETERPNPTYGEIWRTHEAARELLLSLHPHLASELAEIVGSIEAFPPNEIEAVVEAINRWLEACPQPAEVAALGDAVRVARRFCALQTSRSEKLAAEEFARFRGLVRVLDALAERLQPIDLVERHRWLFRPGGIDWPDDDCLRDWRARAARVAAARRGAVEQVLADGAINGLIAFALAMEDPGCVGQTWCEIEEELGARACFLKHCLATEPSEPMAFLLRGILWCVNDDEFPPLFAALEANGQLEPQARLMVARALPGRPATWTAISRLGPEAEAEYWKTVRIDGFSLDDEAAEMAAERLLGADRPRSVLVAFAHCLEKLQAATWVKVMQSLINSQESDTRMPSAHDIHSVFERLDEAHEISEDEIARLEWPFVQVLDKENSRELALHRAMARDPALFVEFLRLAFKRSDGERDPPSPEGVAENAWSLLKSWRSLPGLKRDGSIEASALQAWSKEVRTAAAREARLTVADVVIGEACARARPAPDGTWPPRPILDLLDARDGNDLRRGFATGVYNSRGIVSKAVFEGGGQERELAARYTAIATELAQSHPRLADTFREIASGYMREAQGEDASAELGERWGP